MMISGDKKMEQITLDTMKKADKIIKLVAFYPENIGHTTDSSNRAGCYIIRK